MAYNFPHIFFVFSGLMVAMSLDRRQSLANYVAARALRILPPLLLVSATLALAIGPVMTNATVHEYFTDPQTWLYVPLSGSGLFVPGLPGVFTDVTFAGRINLPTQLRGRQPVPLALARIRWRRSQARRLHRFGLRVGRRAPSVRPSGWPLNSRND
jgi:hypothetical protein